MITQQEWQELIALEEARRKNPNHLVTRGRFLQAMEKHGEELIPLAYRGATGSRIITELAALVPIDQMIEATQTGATLVAWYRAMIQQHDHLLDAIRKIARVGDGFTEHDPDAGRFAGTTGEGHTECRRIATDILKTITAQRSTMK